MLPDPGAANKFLISNGATSAAWTTSLPSIVSNVSLASGADIVLGSGSNVSWANEDGLKQDYNGNTANSRGIAGTGSIVYDQAASYFQWYKFGVGLYMQLDMSTGTPILTIGSGTVWHSGNDGSGSGLDADTVDGQHAAAFAAAAHTHTQTGTYTGNGVTTNRAIPLNFVPQWVILVGGTVTADIVIYHIFGTGGSVRDSNSGNATQTGGVKLTGAAEFLVGAGSTEGNVNSLSYRWIAFGA